MERKVKRDYAFQLECVELVLKKHYSELYVSIINIFDQFKINLLPKIYASVSISFTLQFYYSFIFKLLCRMNNMDLCSIIIFIKLKY